MSSKTKTTATKDEAKPALVPKLRFPEFRNLKGWERRQAGELFTNRIEHGEDALPIYSVTMDDGMVKRSSLDRKFDDIAESKGNKKVHKNDIAYNMMRMWQGAFGVAVEDCMVSPAYVVLAPLEGISSVFFGMLMKTPCLLRSLTAQSHGLTKDRLRLYYKDFARISLPLPSHAEQQKIASCVSSADDLLAVQARKVDALKTHKKGLMQQLFPREGETQPRLRFPEFQNAGEWECQTLADVAQISSGTTPLRSNVEFFAGGTIPWVKTTDLNNSFITQTEECITPKARARINPAGSVLVAMYGGFNQIGRTGCLSVPAATNQALSVLVLNQNRALPAYVLAWLNAKVDDWKRIASSSRKDPNITGTDVAKFPIALPSPAEQQRIATCLRALDALITAETKKHEALKTHKKGLMQQLFPTPEEADA